MMSTDGKPYVKKSEREANRKRRAKMIRCERKAKAWRAEA